MKLQYDEKTKKYKKFKNPKDLIHLAVQDASVQNTPPGFLQLMTVDSVEHSDLQIDPKSGIKSVVASGKATKKLIRIKDDAYMPEEKVSFNIMFRETVDELGVPDIEILSFEVK